MFYILHGDDEFSRSEALARIKKKLGDPAMVDLNTVLLDGRQVTLDELIHACDTLPFLSDRRLVIVEGLLAKLEAQRGKPKEGEKEKQSRPREELAENLKDYLARLPETTRLIFLEEESISQENPIYKLALADERGYVREFKRPQKGDLSRWITDRIKMKGGQILPAAVEELAAFVGNDLRLLDQEIDKLVTYVGGSRPIEEKDVRHLVSYVHEVSIFEMIDALGQRDSEKAIKVLHRLLDENAPPPYLLYMITRQFRILLQIKELVKEGIPSQEIQERLRLHAFVVKKGLQQARNFSIKQLEAAYSKLLEVDAAIKTGRIEPSVALDVLIAELSL